MTNFTQIQTLKAKIPCSTKQALDLLEQSDGKIEKAVEVYHQNNIADIITQTDCNKPLAKKIL
ncbi:Uncharacterised protein [Moraxella lacunata]|uniref:Uncharacterized protein n=1 Tax=Moraxella lacunata TaxID=477 RepID=A0A378T7D3_MORLA|nr:hypothetical protein [Moraxella lacunata]STZ55426.1 Uncharacterised protein [Moraxella lacunata]